MSSSLFFVTADNPGPALVLASLNLFIALGLVCVSLLLGLAVTIAALLCDRAREAQMVPIKVERAAK